MTTPAQALAIALVDEMALGGLGLAWLAPGSRSTPLALALADHPDIQLHVTLDERSAAFAALGAARGSGRPAAVVTTSGTAAANLFPAVQEAHHGRVPLIVLTADRPPELRHTGANQTIDQVKLFGDAVRWFVEVGAPGAEPDDRYWRTLAGRALAVASGSPAGPVHLNIAFRDPLVPEGDGGIGPARSREPATVTIEGERRIEQSDLEGLASIVAHHERGAIVAGPGPEDDVLADRLAEHLGWPLLADPLSNQRRGPNAIAAYDALLRDEGFAQEVRPDLVIRTGALGISKSLLNWVGAAGHHVLVDRDGWWLDPDRSLDRVYECSAHTLFAALTERADTRSAPGGWLDRWRQADTVAGIAIDGILDTAPYSEPLLARELIAEIPEGSNLFVGASMPFRDVEWFGRPRADVRFLGNRGANGIDGAVGTALGIAVASSAPTYALIGDLTLLHDQNALLMRPHGLDLTLIVPNNEGGGIFSFLPQAALSRHFEELFGTPHDRDLADLARFHRCEHVLVKDSATLKEAIRARHSGVRLVEVKTERDATKELHRRIADEVRSTLRAT